MKQWSEAKATAYWSNPEEVRQNPLNYDLFPERSQYLMKVLPAFITPDMTILEAGCNCGRNLNALFDAGFRRLWGVDINAKHLNKAKEIYPIMAARSTMNFMPIQDLEGEWDCIFTMSVLMHVPNDDACRRLGELAKKVLMTCEEESTVTERHFSRNYQSLYEPLGWKQVFWDRFDANNYRLPKHVTRVFIK